MVPIEGVPEPSTGKGEATRARILDIAAQRFAERGYAGTTFSELITASGLTKGAFYFHFPSKEKLALAVLERQQTRWQRRVEEEAEQVPAGMERLRALGPIVLRMMREDPGAQSIARLGRDLRDVDTVAEQVRRFTWAWIELIADVIRGAQDTGEVRQDVDALGTAEVLHGAFEGVKDLGGVLDAPGRPDEAATRAADRLGRFLGLVESSLRPAAADGGRDRADPGGG